MRVLKKIKVYIKLLSILLFVAVFILSTSIVNFLFRNEKKRITICTMITSFLVKIVLLILGVSVKADRTNLENKDNFLVVSNHLSYLDTLVIASKIKSVFIASVDGHQQQFPLGLITKNSGGIFVERKSRTKVKKDLQKIINAIELGFNVVFFPEGTTSDGSGVLPFKTSFFYTSLRSDIKILPICINYNQLNDSPVTAFNSNIIFFHEKIGFTEHFLRLLTITNIDVSLDIDDAVNSGDFLSRKELSGFVYQKISDLYEPKH